MEFNVYTRLITYDPTIMAGLDIERFTRSYRPLSAFIGRDLHAPRQYHALMMDLAIRRADQWFHIFGPPPPRLYDRSSHVCVTQHHNL
jgi:hypothetical protein